MELKINCEKETVDVLQKALDLYCRVLMGDWKELANTLADESFISEEDALKIIEKLTILRNEIKPDMKQSSHYGIAHTNTPKSSKLAYELYGMIRNEIQTDLEINEASKFIPLKCSGLRLPEVNIINN